MSKKYTIEEVREICKEKGYELLSEEYAGKLFVHIKDSIGYKFKINFQNLYKQSKTPVRFYKDNPYKKFNIQLFLKLNFTNLYLFNESTFTGSVIDKFTLIDNVGYKYCVNLKQLCKSTPLMFHKSNIYTIENIKLWIKINNKNFNLLSDTYDTSDKLLKFKCLSNTCGVIFETKWGYVYSGRGCAYCSNRKVSDINSLGNNFPDLIKEWDNVKNINISPHDFTIGSHTKVWWICKNCKYNWQTSIRQRTIKEQGCKRCGLSKGEEKISLVLKHYKIDYEIQKTIEGLIGLGGGKLSYDFYLPKYNVLCEYQGEFHDQQIYENHDLKRQQEHDKRKKEYAKNNNIKLLEIWYCDFDNIEDILVKELGLSKI